MSVSINLFCVQIGGEFKGFRACRARTLGPRICVRHVSVYGLPGLPTGVYIIHLCLPAIMPRLSRLVNIQ